MGKNMKIAVMVSGGGTNLQAIIDRIEDGSLEEVEIALVISNKADAYALKRGEKHNLPTLYLSPKDYPDREAFGKELVKKLQEAEVELVVLAGYLVILPEILIQSYQNRIINIHPSLIPAHCGMGYYGLKVHESVLKRGNKVTGATVHFVDEKADNGPIILQKAVEVLEGDTPESLQKRVMEQAEWQILPKAIALLQKKRVTVVDGIAHIDGGNV